MQTYLSDVQVARRFGVVRSTIWRWSVNGNFPQPVRLSAGVTRWRVADIEEWEQARESETVGHAHR